MIVSLPRRYLVAFSYPDYSKLNSSWHTYTNPRLKNPRPGQHLTHAQSHNLLQIMYYFFRVHILFIRLDLGAAILEGVKKEQENDLGTIKIDTKSSGVTYFFAGNLVPQGFWEREPIVVQWKP